MVLWWLNTKQPKERCSKLQCALEYSLGTILYQPGAKLHEPITHGQRYKLIQEAARWIGANNLFHKDKKNKLGKEAIALTETKPSTSRFSLLWLVLAQLA